LGFSGSRQVPPARVATVSPPVRSGRFSFSQASASASLRVERRSSFSLRRFCLALARVRSDILVHSQASPDTGAQLRFLSGSLPLELEWILAALIQVPLCLEPGLGFRGRINSLAP
jgi:hypothetical protein